MDSLGILEHRIPSHRVVDFTTHYDRGDGFLHAGDEFSSELATSGFWKE